MRTAVIGMLTLMTSLAASSSGTLARLHPLRLPAPPGSQPLYVIGSRGAVPSAPKLDGALADLVRHAPLARPAHVLADLRAMNPAARFAASPKSGTPMVVIDAVTRGDPQALESALVSLGLEHPAVYLNDVSGFLPVSQITHAAARTEVTSLRAALARRRATTGPVATQGDFAQQTAALRTAYPALSGAGVTVGILSDSFNCFATYAAAGSGVPAAGAEGYASNGFTADYATDVATGALPSSVQDVLEPKPDGTDKCTNYQNPDSSGQPTGLPFSDEGRAMLQIVHAVAPGASLAFRTGVVGEADFASGIEALAAAPYGAQVIADDLGYFDEPFFQDGLLSQAIDTVEAKGVAYFSAAGNNQKTPSYINTTPSFNTVAAAGTANAGEKLLNFDATGATTVTSMPVVIPPLFPGDYVVIVVEWDQPYVTGAPDSGGATSQIDVCISGSTAGVVLDYDNNVSSCSGPLTLGTDPYQIMLIANPAVGSSNTAQQTINVQVGLANGTPAPGRIIVAVEDDGQGSAIQLNPVPSGPMLQGHPGAAGAAAVGAAFFFDTPNCGTTPATLEAYSAAGGLPILFDTAGARLATPIVRQKPDFVGPDGVNNTFLGYTLARAGIGTNGMLPATLSQCQNNTNYPNFFGTSAATPHAAAIAALMLQANSSLTPTDIYDLLHMTAAAMPVAQSIASCAAGTQPNVCAGYGFIQAQKAFDQLAPGAPTLTLAASSIAAGTSTTLTWSSPIATGCTASGSWSGSLAASGSKTITPTMVGTDTYTLACANANGSSATPASVKLTVTADPPPSGGGGGGALDGLSLLGLVALCGVRGIRARRSCAARASATSA